MSGKKARSPNEPCNYKNAVDSAGIEDEVFSP